MAIYKMLIAYDGSRYQGWQRLGHTDATIQGKLENVLSRIYQKKIEIDGSGRTDAGVHAKAQVASVSLPRESVDEQDLAMINHYLPEDIQVLRIEKAEARFHARFLAKKKRYRYRISMPPIGNVFERRYLAIMEQPLAIEQMERAARYLVGTHDFRSFTTMKSKKKSTVRTIETIAFHKQAAQELWIDFTGDGFLRQQVRLMMGLLIQVGTGEIQPEQVESILLEKSREHTRMIAPAKGLCLEEVIY